MGDLLTWALGGRTALDPEKVYADARRAMEALETLLATQNTEGRRAWFFGAARPSLFDAHVFSYTHLILDDKYILPDIPPTPLSSSKERSEHSVDRLWGDDTLRKIVRNCPRLVEHAEEMLRTYWPEAQ